MMDKFKLTFGNPQFAKGWPEQKENDYKATLLRSEGQYYLLIFTTNNKLIYSKEASQFVEDDYYEKMHFDQMADPSKDIPNLMIENGKTVRKTGRKEKEGEFEGQNLRLEELKNTLLPPDINKIRKDKSYLKSSENFNLEDLNTFINYYKQRIVEYKSNATFKFKDSYQSFPEFTDHVNEQAYQLNFKRKISKSWLNKQVQEGKLYLFKIHNKDFNSGSTGTKNLHTLYWEMLFDQRNLDDVVFKLNGEAELFYREASIKKGKVYFHKEGIKVPKKFFELPDGTLEPVPAESIKNLNAYFEGRLPENKLTEKDLKYIDNVSIIKKKNGKPGIIKDERFTEDKIQFHCSITMNFKGDGENVINNTIVR